MGETNQPHLTPGFKTSEFWLALVTELTGFFVLSGQLTPVEADALVQAVMSVIGGLTVIIPFIVYFVGRTELKKENLQNSTPVEGVPDPIEAATSSETPQVYPQ